MSNNGKANRYVYAGGLPSDAGTSGQGNSQQINLQQVQIQPGTSGSNIIVYQQQVQTTSSNVQHAPQQIQFIQQSSSTGGVVDQKLYQINQFKSYVGVLAQNEGTMDGTKLRAVEELNNNFEVLLHSQYYQDFLAYAIPEFIRILEKQEPVFVQELNLHQVRKSILSIIHRLPRNDTLQPYVAQLLSTMLHLFNVENEENTLVCVRIFIDFYKYYRPPFNQEGKKFLQFVKSMYAELPKKVSKILEAREPIKLKDLQSATRYLNDIFTQTKIYVETANGEQAEYNLLPRGTQSLKVLQEIPLVIVLYYRFYKENVKDDIHEYISLIVNIIVLHPTLEERQQPNFNREAFGDLMGVQIKTVSFIAFIQAIYCDDIARHADRLVPGLVGLLEACPNEVCNLRKELLVAIRHIVGANLRPKFVQHLDKLFDENVLLGQGWTARETLKPLVYSTLADLVHHVRQDLTLADLTRAVNLFGNIAHDESLNSTLVIQTMACKLLLNLVDSIKNKSKDEPEIGCDLLMRILETFVLKFKTFVKFQLTHLTNRHHQAVRAVSMQGGKEDLKDVEIKLRASLQSQTDDRQKFGFPQQPMSNNVCEYRSLVKTLVCGVKTITWGCLGVYTSSNDQASFIRNFTTRDTLIYIRLLKYGLRALDIYSIPVPNQSLLMQLQGRQMPNKAMPLHNTYMRSQEEKEVLEHFSGVFTFQYSFSVNVFKDVFATSMPFIVDLTHSNNSLQIIINTFLSSAQTSSEFAKILIEYLLSRMEEMGKIPDPSNKSDLYLRLFKLIFGSVTILKDNEKMLQPYLHQIVCRSMELALSAKEPYNYFLLLRGLFRSIGGGSHENLYTQFLPLLPNLLEGLNRLQSGLHKTMMKDLFVELCLTVPVRLSTLLPYLRMLMDPLISALNGSPSLISQGLRTLELCVDNLKTSFLYDLIQPVRADLMQALWKTLTCSDAIALIALRVLGKFGGQNRLAMSNPQMLKYNQSEGPGPTILIEFYEYDKPIELPVAKIIATAVQILKSSTQNATTDSYYYRQCWEVIKCYLAASVSGSINDNVVLNYFLLSKFVDDKTEINSKMKLQKCVDEQVRQTQEMALTGMFVAAAIKELRIEVQDKMGPIVHHYTMLAIVQQVGPLTAISNSVSPTALDPLILIDALAVIMAHEEKELCKPGFLTLQLILDTATNILGSKDRACQLPLMEYLQERMCRLCYDRAWYAKFGGCIAIKFFFDRMSIKWVYPHLLVFLKALLFVIKDLTGEVSSGAVDQAKQNLNKMLMVCISPVDARTAAKDLEGVRKDALKDVTSHLVSLLTTQHALVREQAMYCIRVLACCNGTDVDGGLSVLAPHALVLKEILTQDVLKLSSDTKEKIKKLVGSVTPYDPRTMTAEKCTERDKIFTEVVSEIAQIVLSPDCVVKEQCFYSLRVLAALRGCNGNKPNAIPMAMMPHIEVVKNVVSCKPFKDCFDQEFGSLDEMSRKLLDIQPINYLERMLHFLCTSNEFDEMLEVKKLRDNLTNNIVTRYVNMSREASSLDKEKIMYILRVIAECNGSSGEDDGSVACILLPYVDLLDGYVPLIKHQLKLQSVNAQIGFMDGNRFCMTLASRLFTFDLKEKHKSFFEGLLYLCSKNEDLTKNQCYKNLEDFTPIRKSAVRCFSSYKNLPRESAEVVFNALYNALNWEDKDLQQTAFECMRRFFKYYPIKSNTAKEARDSILKRLGDVRNMTVHLATVVLYIAQLFSSHLNDVFWNHFLPHLETLFSKLIEEKIINHSGKYERVITTIITMYQQCVNANPTLIRTLCETVLENERVMMIEASSPFHEPLMRFLHRYPAEALDLFMKEEKIRDTKWSRFLIYLIKHEDGKVFRDHLQKNYVPILVRYLLVLHDEQSVRMPRTAQQLQYCYEIRHQAIHIVKLLTGFDELWLSEQTVIVDALKTIWIDNSYQELHSNIQKVNRGHWDESQKLVQTLLRYFQNNPDNIELLFELLRAFCHRFIPDFNFLRVFLEKTVAQNYSIEWKREAFFKFIEVFKNPRTSQMLKSQIVFMILIPCFSHNNGEKIQALIGLEGQPNIATELVYQVINFKLEYQFDDCLHIALLQFACLLVNYAPEHFCSGKIVCPEKEKLQLLLNFAWPWPLKENCVDATKLYYKYLLIAYVSDKFYSLIQERIVKLLFKGLLKAHAAEARAVVKQALDVLTPFLPFKLKNGYVALSAWTKKVIIDDSYAVTQLIHIFQLMVRHYKVYYHVRFDLIQYILDSMTRFTSPSSSLDQRKLAVDLADMVIKWELDASGNYDSSQIQQTYKVGTTGAVKRTSGDERPQQPESATPAIPGSTKKSYLGQPLPPIIINNLIKLACQVHETSNLASSPNEILSKRCIALLKTVLVPDVWLNKYDFKLDWAEKILQDNREQNSMCIAAALEILNFLVTVMKPEQILNSFKPLQISLNACLTNKENKIIVLMQKLLDKLMAIFPIEKNPVNNLPYSKRDHLQYMYTYVGKVIMDGLKNYTNSPSSLSGPLMFLKACCSKNPSCMEEFLQPLIKVIQQMTEQHLTPTQAHSDSPPDKYTSDILILSLDLVKSYIPMMTPEIRKTYIGNILVSLIEKSPDTKLLKAITKMLEDWVKNRTSEDPIIREKSILLTKLMINIDKRFPVDCNSPSGNLELTTLFLELVNYIYRDPYLKNTELVFKLQPAFMSGLKCAAQPLIREKFFAVFDQSMKRNLHERLMKIITTQNWDTIGQHYWIKQSIELMFGAAISDRQIKMGPNSSLLPSVDSVIRQMEGNKEMAEFHQQLKRGNSKPEQTARNKTDRDHIVAQIVRKQVESFEKAKAINTQHFLKAAAQLCHRDTSLAERVWLDLFPRMWSLLDRPEQEQVACELPPFLTAACHNIQKDLRPSVVNTFVEAMCLCQPPIPLSPVIMKYLGENHNVWHRMALNLESMALPKTNKRDCYEFDADSQHQQVVDSLIDMYDTLKEEDMWAALWHRHAKLPETKYAITYEQHGFYEQAQGAYQVAMSKLTADVNFSPREIRMWENNWIRCCKELNQWEVIADYAMKNEGFPLLLLESTWRVCAQEIGGKPKLPNWDQMREAIKAVESCCPREMGWKVHLYRGYLEICDSKEKKVQTIEQSADFATRFVMRDWRRLPRVVSHAHIPLLQATQQINEYQEAIQFYGDIKCSSSSDAPQTKHMGTILNTWVNRLPLVCDRLSYWSDIFCWRYPNYEHILSQVQEKRTNDTDTRTQELVVHGIAQLIVQFSRCARKHNLLNVSQNSILRIYELKLAPLSDLFFALRERVKCKIQMALTADDPTPDLEECFSILAEAKTDQFLKVMKAEHSALKGLVLTQLGHAEFANRCFAEAINHNDNLAKAWGLWGDYFEKTFIANPKVKNNGVAALACFLNACSYHEDEKPSRTYLPKVLWLLTYDDKELMASFERHNSRIQTSHWLPWIPQLVNCLQQYDSSVISNLLSNIGRQFPQAVYLPMRTKYYTLKFEQRSQAKKDDDGSTPQESFKASREISKCVTVMSILKNWNPIVLESLEVFIDELSSFRESWYEEVSRKLRQLLQCKCYTALFENRHNISEAKISSSKFIKMMVNTFGTGVVKENVDNTADTSTSLASESIARKIRETEEDPVFKRLKNQFIQEFDQDAVQNMSLYHFTNKVRRWVNNLENETKSFPQSVLIEEKCQFLSNFSLKTAEIELPGEYQSPKMSNVSKYVRIAKFMPRVEIIQKHNSWVRRLYIRGNNGRVYPYLVVYEAFGDSERREGLVLQLLRMLNSYLEAQKETAKRFLQFTVPKVVPVSPYIRLVQDNPSSLSLLDIYKKGCSKMKTLPCAPVSLYYERLSTTQQREKRLSQQRDIPLRESPASLNMLRDILKYVQANMVPKTMLKTWALQTYPTAEDYWTFRKMVTLQLSLACFSEYVFHLTRLNPEMIYFHQDCGMVNVSYFKFDIDEMTGELNSNRLVPFRLTPNIVEFMNSIGVSGPFTASMIATARCLRQPNFKIQSILRVILKDEIVESIKAFKRRSPDEADNRSADAEMLVNIVNKSTNMIFDRMSTLANSDVSDCKVTSLIATAMDPDKLCRMDPCWHPWL